MINETNTFAYSNCQYTISGHLWNQMFIALEHQGVFISVESSTMESRFVIDKKFILIY